MPPRRRPNALNAFNTRAYGRFARNVYRGARYQAARRAGAFGIGSTAVGRASNYLWNKASSYVFPRRRSSYTRRRHPRSFVVGKSGTWGKPVRVGPYHRTKWNSATYVNYGKRFTPKHTSPLD